MFEVSNSQWVSSYLYIIKRLLWIRKQRCRKVSWKTGLCLSLIPFCLGVVHKLCKTFRGSFLTWEKIHVSLVHFYPREKILAFFRTWEQVFFTHVRHLIKGVYLCLRDEKLFFALYTNIWKTCLCLRKIKDILNRKSHLNLRKNCSRTFWH